VLTSSGGGYTCPQCNQFVPLGIYHSCAKIQGVEFVEDSKALAILKEIRDLLLKINSDLSEIKMRGNQGW